MRRVFVDSVVLLLAFGRDHPQRHSCRALVEAARTDHLEVNLSVEAVQEVVFHRMRVSGREPALAVGRAVRGFATLHAFDAAVLDRALELMAVAPIRGRDAVHAATALLAGFDHIVTVDADFVAVPGLRTLTPREVLP